METLAKPTIDFRGRNRAVIEDVTPEIDAGRFPIKRSVGEGVIVEAAIFGDGHDVLSATLKYRMEKNSGWSEKRKRRASRAARNTQFFKFAHPASRREMAPFLRAEVLERLGENCVGLGEKFESRVRVLFRQGFTDGEIADALGVNRMTVNMRTKRWRHTNGKR